MPAIADEIIAGRRLSRNDDLTFLTEAETGELCRNADRIRKALCGDHVDLCSIVNGRSGRCPENCKFCAQSAHNHTGIDEYPFLDEDSIVNECRHNADKGVHRFSIVTAGRTLSDEDFEKAVSAYSRMSRECGIKLCASHGLLTEEQFTRLRESGVTTYHCNIETSRRNFPNICTTHTFDDKIACIKRAQKCGLNVCSGGIIGMGETWEDRLDMALTLAELGIGSIPINALRPVKGTPLESETPLTEEDILRTAAIFRFIDPTAYIRLAAGRIIMRDSGSAAFLSGANATITGDMLTTSGNDIEGDIKMLKGLGLDVSAPER
ncbi:MAG: biotin synthase BioB [Ruminiclostridium sp.]|nr:biotin synthase BioB [Ruminiclostridium sp.]